MLSTHTTVKLRILRLLALVAIAFLSFEMTSTFFVCDDSPIEIVDLDLDDDTETDDETYFVAIEAVSSHQFDVNLIRTHAVEEKCPLLNLYKESLPCPPPEKS